MKHRDEICTTCRDLGNAKIPCMMFAYCKYARMDYGVDNDVIPFQLKTLESEMKYSDSESCCDLNQDK